MVVPYQRSLSRVKEQSAKSGLPCANTARRSKAVPLATWDMMRPCLQQLLSTAGQPMPLSNLKRLFRAQFNVELSETALGHAKLSECLQDPRVRDLCDVRLQGQGYTIVPAKKPVQRSLISLADSLPVMLEATMAPPTSASNWTPGPLLLAPGEASHQPEQLDDHEEVSGSRSGGLLGKRGGSIQPLSMEAIHSPPGSPRMAAGVGEQQQRGQAQQPQTPFTPFPQTPFPPTPSPSAACLRSLPRLLGRMHAPQSSVVVPSKEFGLPSALQMGLLPQDGHHQLLQADKVAPPPPAAFFEGLPAATLATMGFGVHNTFLHAPLPPPTPVRAAARCRARSLPRPGHFGPVVEQ